MQLKVSGTREERTRTDSGGTLRKQSVATFGGRTAPGGRQTRLRAGELSQAGSQGSQLRDQSDSPMALSKCDCYSSAQSVLSRF